MISSLINSFSEWKKSYGLTQPGLYESAHTQARSVFLTNLIFEGGKADLAKGLSPNFQVAHSFSIGSNQSMYHFGTVYVNGRHLLHGMMDSMGTFQGKYNYTLANNLTAKFQSHVHYIYNHFCRWSQDNNSLCCRVKWNI